MSGHVVGAVHDVAPRDWDDFVDQSQQRSIYHRSAWIDLVRETFGHRVFFLTAHDAAGRLSGVLPLVQQKSVLFGNFLTSVPFFNYGGPLAESDASTTALLDCASRLGEELSVAHIELRMSYAKECGWLLRQDKVALLRELPSSVGELGKQLGSKLRSQIKRVERESPVVLKGGLEYLSSFYYVFSRNMRDLGTPVYSIDFFRNMLVRFPRNCHLVCIEVKGVPSAAAFLVTNSGVTEIPWASCTKETKPLGANMRLYWECLVESINRGSSKFDFGRSSKDAGTYRFKTQWGGVPHQLYWYYWLPGGGDMPQLNSANPKMSLAIQLWKKMPLWFCEMVGPQIVRFLP